MGAYKRENGENIAAYPKGGVVVPVIAVNPL